MSRRGRRSRSKGRTFFDPPLSNRKRSTAAAVADDPPICCPCFAGIREGAQLSATGCTHGSVFTCAGSLRTAGPFWPRPGPIGTGATIPAGPVSTGPASALMADPVSVGSCLAAVAESPAFRATHAANRCVFHGTCLCRRARAWWRRPVAGPIIDSHTSRQHAGRQQHCSSRQKNTSESHQFPLLCASGSANNA